MKHHNRIETFSANCPLRRHVIDDVQIGRYEGCQQMVYNINNMTDTIKTKLMDYGIALVPTTIIDGKIKIAGIPDFPWICGNDLYKKLKTKYSM